MTPEVDSMTKNSSDCESVVVCEITPDSSRLHINQNPFPLKAKHQKINVLLRGASFIPEDEDNSAYSQKQVCRVWCARRRRHH